MHSFVDARERKWDLEIDVAMVIRVRDAAQVNLYNLGDDTGQKFAELLDDPVKLVGVLYVLCGDQAEEKGVSAEGFGRGFKGNFLEAAIQAFAEELIDFFPSPAARDNLRKLLARSRELVAKLMARGSQALDSLDLDTLAKTFEQLVWQLAGILGLDPRPYKYGQLCLMARGRVKEHWTRTAEVLAALHNLPSLTFKGKLPYRSWQFNPFSPKLSSAQLPKKNPAAWKMLREAFCGK